MITLYKEPNKIISTGNDNWYVFQDTFMDIDTPPSDLYLEVSLFNSKFLVPASAYSTGLIGFNASPILNDYVSKLFLDEDEPKVSYIEYDLDIQERFSGLYITFSLDQSGSTYSTSTFSVVNNNTLTSLEPYSTILKSGFYNNSTDNTIYIKSSSTSGGYVNKLYISSSPTASVPVVFNLSNNSYGYIELRDYPIISYGATLSVENKLALKASIDFLSLNYDDNFDGYKIGATGAGFLTRAPKDIYMKDDEIYTLSFIADTELTGSNFTEIELNIESAYGLTTTTISLPDKVSFHTIDVSPTVLGITSSTYSVYMSFDGGDFYSEKVYFNLGCYGTKDYENIRLCWLNELGGIDFYTFKFIETHTRTANKSTFNKSSWDDTYEFRRKNYENIVYRVENYDNYLVVSGLIDYDTNLWLSSIIKSKYVWWYRNGEYVAVVVNTNSLDVSTYRNDLEVKIEFRLSKSNIN